MNTLTEDDRSFFAAALAPALAGLLLLSACDTTSNARNQPSFEMSTQAVANIEGDTTLVVEGDTVVFSEADFVAHPDSIKTEVTIRDGQIRIFNGYFELGAMHQYAVGEVEQAQNTIRVSIRSEEDRQPNVVPAMGKPVLYDAYVTDLEAGTYQLVVRHKGDVFRAHTPETSGDWITVTDQQIIVP